MVRIIRSMFGSKPSVRKGKFRGFFDHGMTYLTPGLLPPDGMHLFQKGRRVPIQELVGFVDRALSELGRGKGKIPGLPVMSNGMVFQKREATVY